MKELPDFLCTQFIKRYNTEINAGSTIEINYKIPYVAINFNDGTEYFFQGDEASELIDSIPDNINEEVYILAIAQDW